MFNYPELLERLGKLRVSFELAEAALENSDDGEIRETAKLMFDDEIERIDKWVEEYREAYHKQIAGVK